MALSTNMNEGLVTTHDELEQIRFDMLDFKQSFKAIADIFSQTFQSILSDEEYQDIEKQIGQCNGRMVKVETHLESMCLTISKSITDQQTEEDELARSLKEIEVCYQKNKLRLEKDLNKMEFKVAEIRDTRERISLRHIKSLDIVEKVVHKVMPNSLTESQIQKNMIVASNTQGSRIDTENNQMSSIEQIRNDLENDDIFTLVYRGSGGGGGVTEDNANNDDTLNDNDSSSDGRDEERKEGDDQSSINSDVEEIKELKSEKKRILESIDNENIHDKVLIDQLYDMEIQKVKKSLRLERRSVAQSHRQQRENFSTDFDPNFNQDYKSQSLKNSQKITTRVQQSKKGKKLRNISIMSPPQDQSISDIPSQSINDQNSPVQNQPKYLKIAPRSEQQLSKKALIIKPQQIQPQILFSNEKQQPPPQMIQIKQLQQQKPFVLNKKFVNLIKKQNVQNKSGNNDGLVIQTQQQQQPKFNIREFDQELSPKQ